MIMGVVCPDGTAMFGNYGWYAELLVMGGMEFVTATYTV